MFSVVWQYRVSKQHQSEFESIYGSAGIWAHFFKQSPRYNGSCLFKQVHHQQTYLLIDNWSSEKSYEDFKSRHREMYGQLSKKFEFIYEEELKLGQIAKPD